MSVELSDTFRHRWRSGRHVGAATPRQEAYVRRGKFRRNYRKFTFLDGSEEDFADFPNRNGVARKGWSPRWYPSTAYQAIPNISSIQIGQNFDNNGIKTCTIECDNIVMKSIAGVLGTYHLAKRGYLSPLRRYTWGARPPTTWAEVNEWATIFDAIAQVTVHQGYGDELTPTFTGLIDQVDMTSNPDKMTITLRGFAGPTLADQRLFGWNKDPRVKVPVTFADRMSQDDVERISGGARASSSDSSHPARGITVPGTQEFWLSSGHAGPNHTEWVEITLPKGRYENFYLYPRHAGAEVFVGIKLKNRAKAKPGHPAKRALVDGDPYDEGWFYPPAHPDWIVPSTPDNGGWPYFHHFKSLDAIGTYHTLRHKFEVGDGTKLRIGFRNLPYVGYRDSFRAGCNRLIAMKRKVNKKKQINNRYVLVDDAADVVKVVLSWAGYREWEIESFGWKIARDKPWVFHQGDFLIDLINYVKGQGDYVFFESAPSGDDRSMGVPIFRHQRALQAPGNEAVQVTDRNLLTGINASLNLAGRPSVIHVRGREAKKGERGRTMGEDTAKRLWAKYAPLWHRDHRDGGILRAHTYTDFNLSTRQECMVAAIMIAMQYQLQTFTGHIEIPGFPGVELDDQVGVIDEGTGANTRIWAADVQSTFQSGEQANWTTTVGGSMIDTQDWFALALDFFAAAAARDKDREGGHGASGGVRTITGTGTGQGTGSASGGGV
jgi:hypothetical protein